LNLNDLILVAYFDRIVMDIGHQTMGAHGYSRANAASALADGSAYTGQDPFSPSITESAFRVDIAKVVFQR
jgi:hypothetical protein